MVLDLLPLLVTDIKPTFLILSIGRDEQSCSPPLHDILLGLVKLGYVRGGPVPELELQAQDSRGNIKPSAYRECLQRIFGIARFEATKHQRTVSPCYLASTEKIVVFEGNAFFWHDHLRFSQFRQARLRTVDGLYKPL